MIRKSVFITGASGDIGAKLVERFAQNGYDVVATYNNGSIEKLKNICAKLNVDFKAYKMNIENVEEIESCFKEAFKNSPYIDCVVCNAGISLNEMLLCDMEEQDIDKIININFRGTIYCNKAAVKHFIKQKHGNIINISSIYGLYGGACESVYSATKAGIIGLTKSLALEVASLGIRVNAVAPGFIETKMTAHFTSDEKEKIKDNTPMGRLGNTDDVAAACLFLASDEASFITGETINVNGGALRF